MKKSTKRIITVSLSAILVAAVGASGTYAYLTAQTEKRANNFTFNSAMVHATLIEPSWDGIVGYDDSTGAVIPVYDYIDHDNDESTPNVPVYGYVNGDVAFPVLDINEINEATLRPLVNSDDVNFVKPMYGDENAQDMIPGSYALKDPRITNTGEEGEWIASKITFVYAEGSENEGKALSLIDYKKVTDAIEIDYDVDGAWELVEGTVGESDSSISKVFYYKSKLAAGETTLPVFTRVSVKISASNAQIKALEEMGGFAIWVEGFAAQGDISDEYNAVIVDPETGDEKVEGFRLWGLVEGNVVFANTPSETVAVPVARPGIVGK